MSNRKPSLGVKLAVDRLDDRNLPSITLYQHSDTWTSGSGNVTVTATVTDEGAGTYKWDYQLHNDSYLYVSEPEEQGVRIMSVHVPDPSVLNGWGNSIGADSNLGTPNGLGSAGTSAARSWTRV